MRTEGTYKMKLKDSLKTAVQGTNKRKTVILEFILILIGLFEFYPIFMVISNAFKTKKELAVNSFGFPIAPTIDNIVIALVRMKFYRSMFNTILVTLVSMIIIIVFASMASYPLSRLRGKKFSVLYIYFLSGIMIPYQITIIPLYKLVKELGLINNYIGLILIYGAIFISFPIFLYTGFIKTIPVQLEEAAIVDGCGRLKIFWLILFPLMKPATASVAVLSLLNLWNDFLMSLLFLQRPNLKTVTVSLFSFRGQYHVDWSLMFAGILLAILPMIIFFLFMQKYFIKGIAEGAVKG